MKTVAVERLEHMVQAILAGHGAPIDHARLQTDLLVSAELAGQPSHGLLRLPRIIERIARNVCDPTTKGRCDWARESYLEVDGDRGLGPVVATTALDALCSRVPRTGIAMAAVRNNNHIGMLAWHANRVASRNLACILFTTSEALVHPHGGRTALVGTNPVAIAVPGGGEPLVLDMATSLVAMGKIHDHAIRDVPIPRGWALDADGNPTTDAVAAKSGAIAPFGGAKGYALGLAIEVLVSLCTGAALGRDVKGTLDSDQVCNKGDVFIVIDPGAMPGRIDMIRDYLQQVRDCAPADPKSPVLVPGDRARASKRERMAAGIPVDADLLLQLQTLFAQTLSHRKTST